MAMAGACLTGQEAMEPPRAVHHSIVAPLCPRYKARAIECFGTQSAMREKTPSPHGPWRFRTKFIGMGYAYTIFRAKPFEHTDATLMGREIPISVSFAEWIVELRAGL
jgi:hypothetical protein